MLRHSYDNCKINHTVSQVEILLQQTYDRSYYDFMSDFELFCKSCFCTTTRVPANSYIGLWWFNQTEPGNLSIKHQWILDPGFLMTVIMITLTMAWMITMSELLDGTVHSSKG